MSISSIPGEIVISGFVSGGDQLVDTDNFVPKDGEKVTIVKFEGNTPPSSLVAIRLVWDYEGANEEDVWSIPQEGKIPFSKTITGDGVKRLALVAENNCTGDYYFSGFLRYKKRLFNVSE